MADIKLKTEYCALHGAFATLLSNTADAVYLVDPTLVFDAASDVLATQLGLADADELLGRSMAEVLPASELASKHLRDDRTVLAEGKPLLSLVDTVTDANGATRHIMSSKYPIFNEDGETAGVLCISREVTREYAAQQDYLQEVQYLLRIYDDAYGAWLFDLTAWRVVDARASASELGAIPQHDTINAYLRSALDTASGNDELRAFLSALVPETLRTLYHTGQRRLDYEYLRTMEDGRHCWVHLVIRLLLDPINGHLMAVASLTDINKEKAAQSDLIKAAELDSMTGVLNHDATLSHMEQFLSGDGAGGLHALLMVDRDELKRINDTLGHQTGDEIIVETARVLRGVFRDSDIVGRVGGDEFLVLMKNIGKTQTARRKAGELLQSLQCICGPADRALESTGSIGIAFYRGDHKTLDKLYAEADSALYQAKAEGRNRFVIYHSGDEAALEPPDSRDALDTVNLRTLLNSIDGGILILHTEPGKALLPVFFSDSFLTMMGGLTQDEAFKLYGNDLFECIHPDERERVRGEYAAALESGDPLRTTYRLMGKDDQYHWLSAGTNITRNEDGKIDVYAVHTNIEKLMHREEKLASDEQRFRMAFTQTARMLFEVDVPTASLIFYARVGMTHGPETMVEGLPGRLSEGGFLHERSKTAFEHFYAEMCAGKQQDSKLFFCRYFSTGQYGWVSISYETVLDANGKPLKAIGSIEELPNIARAQERLDREDQLMQTLGEALLATVKANLTRDQILFTQTDPENSFAALAAGSYSALAELLVGTSPYPEDTMLLQLNLPREGLLDAYPTGKRWLAVEYRRIDGDEIRWTKVSITLLEDPVTHDLYGYLYLSDVEKRRGAESVLPVTVERDQVTHLYTQSTVERLIDSLMRGSGAVARQYSLALLRMTGLPAMSAKIGAENLDLEKMYLGRVLGALLDGDCIIGRYGSDGILIFCPDAASDDWMRQKIENALFCLEELHQKRGAGEYIRLVCGISTEQARNAELTGMLAQAVRICDAYQSGEEHQVFTFEQYVDTFRISADDLDHSAVLLVSEAELERPLFGGERAAMTECMSAMLSADRYDSSVVGALSVLGRYYGAQRVYTLSLTSGNTAISGLHEWVAVGRHSTLRQMSGIPLTKLPMFKRALVAARPVILDGRSRRSDSGADAPWCFITLPIITERKVQGFLCIENPEKHRTDVALVSAMIPLLMHERNRFGLSGNGLRVTGRDELTGLPDRTAFERVMQSFNPDSYHTIGCFYLSAVNLRELNRLNGVVYGDDMLVFAAQTLTGVIKRAQIFRMSGTEFAAVCTNLSREAFQGQCARTQSVLQRRYPKCFAFGDAWSDKGASARKLLNEAENLSNNGVEKNGVSVGAQSKLSGNAVDLRQRLQSGQFYIVLQPQVDLRTGTVVGAEALARCRGSDGRPILPGEFVHSMEESGLIRELDYFVLEQTFHTLQTWLDQGLKPIPLAVNFSRQTLLSPTVLASSLAIRSRYDVPEDLVELEVTESVGDYEPERLREVMDGMYQQGFKFALDDLGSEYSSLKTLGDLRFDAVKLDKSLINSFLYNSMSRSVVESIIGICAKNGVRCIAEGVESEMHAKGLLEAGCIFAQGFYYGKPMPVEDFRKRFLK